MQSQPDEPSAIDNFFIFFPWQLPGFLLMATGPIKGPGDMSKKISPILAIQYGIGKKGLEMCAILCVLSPVFNCSTVRKTKCVVLFAVNRCTKINHTYCTVKIKLYELES